MLFDCLLSRSIVSDSLQPFGLQPTWLLVVGGARETFSCLFLSFLKWLSLVWLLYDPKNYSPPGSSFNGIFQARIVKWISSSKGSPSPRNQTQCLLRWLEGSLEPPGIARGALSIPLLTSTSETFSVPFLTLIKLRYTKALEWLSLVPGPEAKPSSEIWVVHHKILRFYI